MKYINKEYIKNISNMAMDEYYILEDYSIDYNNYIEILERYFPSSHNDEDEDEFLFLLRWFELCTYSYTNKIIYTDELSNTNYIIMGD